MTTATAVQKKTPAEAKKPSLSEAPENYKKINIPTPMKTAKKSDFRISEYARNTFNYNMPKEWDYEDLFVPTFWTNVAGQLLGPAQGEKNREGSIIEVSPVDHSWFARLYVTKVQKDSLEVVCIGPAIDENFKTAPVDLATQKAWKGRN